MNLIQQPKPSRTCGHHCLAMILDVPVQDIIEQIGHTHGTKPHELMKILEDYGYKVNLKPYKNRKYLNRICILGIRWGKGGHWRVYNDGVIYDPGFDFTFTFDESFHREDGGHYDKVINIWKR